MANPTVAEAGRMLIGAYSAVDPAPLDGVFAQSYRSPFPGCRPSSDRTWPTPRRRGRRSFALFALGEAVKVAGGFKLFQGIVTKADMKGERGHTYWDVELKGTGLFGKHSYKVWVKNENIMSWLDGQVDVMPPDLICQLDPKTGDAVTGVPLGGYPLNGEVAIVGIPAHPMWRVPKGIEIFGPRYFGYDVDYVPIEELQKRRLVKLATV